jgi:hypothetical protein
VWAAVGVEVEAAVGHNYQFVFSQKGGVYMLTFKMYNENRCQLLTAFPFKILDDASSSWNGAGIAASGHCGST